MAHVPIDFTAIDPAALDHVPSNRGFLALRECTEVSPGPRDSIPWRIGGYTISTHPDLVEWTAALAASIGSGFAFVCGRPVILDGERILGWGRGTLDFVIRSTAVTAPEIRAAGGHTEPRTGDGWLVFPAFLPGVQRDERLPTISRWLAEARGA